MAALKTITTHRLVVLLVDFLLGNSYLLLPTNPDSACSTDLYLPVALLSGSLVLTTVAAAAILLYVRMALSSAEAKAAAILLYVRMALSSAEAKAAAACKQGVDYKVYVSPGWRKLRALLLLAIGLSLASTFLAIVTFEFGSNSLPQRTQQRPLWLAGMGADGHHGERARLLRWVAAGRALPGLATGHPPVRVSLANSD